LLPKQSLFFQTHSNQANFNWLSVKTGLIKIFANDEFTSGFKITWTMSYNFTKQFSLLCYNILNKYVLYCSVNHWWGPFLLWFTANLKMFHFPPNDKFNIEGSLQILQTLKMTWNFNIYCNNKNYLLPHNLMKWGILHNISLCLVIYLIWVPLDMVLNEAWLHVLSQFFYLDKDLHIYSL